MLGWVSLSVLVVYVLSWPGGVQSAKCPWDEKGLLLWSDSSTWSSGSVPGDNEKVCKLTNQTNHAIIQPQIEKEISQISFSISG